MARDCVPTFGWLRSLDSIRNLFRLVVVLVSILHRCSSADIGVIGILAEVNNPTECKQIVPTTVYETEAMKWLLNLLNANNYTLDVKLEIDIVDVCEARSSVLRTIDLINKYKTGPKKLIGILSMTTSANMLNVSWYLSNLPEKEQLIQIGTAETAYKLNNRNLYPTFFRVVPDDEFQIKLIAELLKLLKWNYIAILHEKDVYGEEGARLLTQYLPAYGVTLATKMGLDSANHTFNEQLTNLKIHYQGVEGVVVIAQQWTLKDASKRSKDFCFILTEALMMSLDACLFQNSFAISQQQFSFPSIEKNWEELFNSDSIQNNTTFRLMREQRASWTNRTASAKDMSKVIHKMSVLPKLVGLYTLAFLVRENRARCGNLTCQLSAVKLDDIQTTNIDLSYLSEILSLPSINGTASFNEKGNLLYPNDFQPYQVYSSMEADDKCTFKKVGEHNGKNLTLKETKNFKICGVCRSGQYCHKDIPTFIYKEGDIMLFGIVPMRAGNDAENCPRYDTNCRKNRYNSQLAEAIFYAVETLNQKKLYKDLFPNKKIGIIVMDSCNHEIPTFEALLSFLRGSASICEKTLNCTKISSKTLVYIGGMTSEVSIRILNLIRALNAVQISYASTSSVFRNPLMLNDPHFLRVVPSDDLQILAIVDICARMQWKYVSLIYADNEYGRSAQKQLTSKAKDVEMCITQSLPYKYGDDSDKLMRELRRRPEAKVVIVFVNFPDLKIIISQLVHIMEEGEFRFLGSAAWERYPTFGGYDMKLSGSLSLGIDIPSNRGFEDYRKRTALSVDKSNPWTLADRENECHMPRGLNKRCPNTCKANSTLIDMGEQSQWAAFVIQSVYAAAIGLNMSISKLCSKMEVCPTLFQKFPEVIEIFKKVELKDPDGMYKRVFDANGDGALSYNVYKMQTVNRKLTYIKIGNWSKKSGLVLDIKQIDTPTLKCPNQKRCSECPSFPKEEKDNYIVPLVGFIFLLLILIIIIVLFCICSKLHFDRNNLGTTGAVDNPSYMADESVYTDPDNTDPKVIFRRGTASANPAYEGFKNINSQNNLNNLPVKDSTKNVYISIENIREQTDRFEHEETTPKQLVDEDDSDRHLRVPPVAYPTIYPVSDDDESTIM